MLTSKQFVYNWSTNIYYSIRTKMQWIANPKEILLRKKHHEWKFRTKKKIKTALHPFHFFNNLRMPPKSEISRLVHCFPFFWIFLHYTSPSQIKLKFKITDIFKIWFKMNLLNCPYCKNDSWNWCSCVFINHSQDKWHVAFPCSHEE